MAQSNTIQIRVDPKLKAESDALFAELGIDTPTAVRMFLKQSVMHRGIPFALVSSSFSPETVAAVEDVKNGRGLHGPFASVEALMEDLNA